MDRYSLRGYKSHTHYVRSLHGLDEEIVTHQVMAEIEAQALAREYPRAVIVLHRPRDGWEKIVRADRPPTGRGPWLVSGDFDEGKLDE
jgi:hypothetical protein